MGFSDVGLSSCTAPTYYPVVLSYHIPGRVCLAFGQDSSHSNGYLSLYVALLHMIHDIISSVSSPPFILPSLIIPGRYFASVQPELITLGWCFASVRPRPPMGHIIGSFLQPNQ